MKKGIIVIALLALGIALIPLHSCGNKPPTASSAGYSPNYAYTDSPGSLATAAGSWSSGPSMNVAGLLGGEAAKMSDGKYVVIKEEYVEVYDPAANTWTQKTSFPRTSFNGYYPTDACRLAGTDKFIVLTPYGAFIPSPADPAKSFIYDYNADSWTETGAPVTAPVRDTLVCLPGGNAFVTGSDYSVDGTLKISAGQLYTAATGQWSATAAMNHARRYSTAVALGDGRVLAIGGSLDSNSAANEALQTSAEIYDPGADKWSDTGSLNIGRMWARAVRLNNGNVLVTGGYRALSGFLASAEIYDALAGTWTLTGAMGDRRMNHALFLLSDGTVMAAGGRWQDEVYTSNIDTSISGAGQTAWTTTINGGYTLATADIYDPSTGVWKRSTMPVGREYPVGIGGLALGKALVCGGSSSLGTVAEQGCSLWTPQ